jgi:hypothetical protein
LSVTAAGPTLHVLIVGRLLDSVDETRSRVHCDRVVLYGATTLDEVRKTLALNPIDLMVIGAAIELSERLAIARAAFEMSETITVHLKDKASGPPGFAPFIERVIAARRMADAQDTIRVVVSPNS